MKVSGENTFLYQITGQQQFKEASVKQEGSSGWMGLFGSKSITIDAGAGDDEIAISKLGPNAYEVDINGQKFVLTEAEMKNLTIKGGSGNDHISIDASVDIAIDIDGGSGDDTIVNYADGVSIDGGSGDDTIVSIANFTEIMGGSGSDLIYSDGVFNDIYGDQKTQSFLDLLFGTKDEPDTIFSKGFFNSVKE